MERVTKHKSLFQLSFLFDVDLACMAIKLLYVSIVSHHSIQNNIWTTHSNDTIKPDQVCVCSGFFMHKIFSRASKIFTFSQKKIQRKRKKKNIKWNFLIFSVWMTEWMVIKKSHCYAGTDVISLFLGAPFVRNMPNTMTAVAGKTFNIKCPVAGYPISAITWEKDEQLLPSTIRQTVSPNGTLTIRDVDRSVDSGW